MKIQDTYTIEEMVDIGKYSEYNYRKYSFREKLVNGSEITIENILWDYMDYLKDISLTIKLGDEDYRKYRFKPRLLCNKVYGDGELYFIILMINNIADIKDFDMDTFLMPKKKELRELLSKIYNAESLSLNSYNK